MPHVLTVLLLLCTAACASTSSSALDSSAPTRVSYHDYSGGKILTLVNESHTNRLEFYSTQRPDADTKVAADDDLADLLESFRDADFSKFAQSGQAPRRSGELTKAIEVQSAGGTSYIGLGARLSSADEARAFTHVLFKFLDTYNGVLQAQAVEGQPAEEVFAPPQYKQKNRD